MAPERYIVVTVLFPTGPRRVTELELHLSLGCTLAHAIERSALLQSLTATEKAGLAFGVWGKKADDQLVLRDQDRVEVYRPLTVDPKRARRERFVRQGARQAAGLFAQRRVGAKAGY